MPRLARDRRYATLKDYQPAEGPLWLREAAALWMKRFVPAADASSLFIGMGAQHTLACVLASVSRPGHRSSSRRSSHRRPAVRESHCAT
jgi:aspartate/methionine/tyrosine aminotransferase